MDEDKLAENTEEAALEAVTSSACEGVANILRRLADAVGRGSVEPITENLNVPPDDLTAAGMYSLARYNMLKTAMSEIDKIARPCKHDAEKRGIVFKKYGEAPVKEDGAYDPCISDHITRQMAFSYETFGPGPRTEGVTNHIEKEIAEIRDASEDEVLEEWVDVILLAFDGAWRSGAKPEQIAQALGDKQTKNENRTWPDWREAEEGEPIEHVEED